MNMKNYKTKEHLSASSAVVFRRCPRLYFYKIGCNLVKNKNKGLPLIFGSAIHAALPFAYNDPQKALLSFKEIWKDNDMFEDKKRNTMRATAMIENFHNHHKDNTFYTIEKLPQPTEYDLAERVSSDETPFVFDIDRRQVVVGRIDNAARHTANGHLFCVEYKTTSELSLRFLHGFQSNIQIFTYALALNIFARETYHGVILDALRVSPVNTETITMPIFVDSWMHEQTIKWYQKVADDIEKCENEEDFPCNRSLCTPYGAFGSCGYMCPYLDLCSIEDWTDLYQAFEVEERKPFIVKKAEEDKCSTQN